MKDKKANVKVVLSIISVIVIILAIAVAVYYLADGGSNSGTTVNNTNNSNNTILASVNNDCSGTAFFIGVTQGFFKDAGLNFVDVGQTVTSQQPTALAIGQVDVLDTDPMTLVELLMSGVNVTAVAQSGVSATDGDPDKEYLHWDVTNNSDLTTFASINNSSTVIKIGINTMGGDSQLQTNALLQKYNISPDKIEYVVIPEQNQQEALIQGLIDVACLQPAFYGCSEYRIHARPIATSADAMGSAGGMSLIVFTDSFIQQHPETVDQFIIAYKDAERWADDNRQEAGNITAQRLGLCQGGAIAHYYSYSGAINTTQLQDWLNEMTVQGVIKPGQYTPSDLYTDEFQNAWNDTNDTS
jgi:ABC-type nitrate/sulfonate/bicarbonate transport system substrate-binding protein